MHARPAGSKKTCTGNLKMKIKAFALRDIKLGAYASPIFAPNQGVMLRELTEFLNAPQKTADPQKFPQDFTLNVVGEYETDSGQFTPSGPDHVCSLSDLLVQSN